MGVLYGPMCASFCPLKGKGVYQQLPQKMKPFMSGKSSFISKSSFSTMRSHSSLFCIPHWYSVLNNSRTYCEWRQPGHVVHNKCLVTISIPLYVSLFFHCWCQTIQNKSIYLVKFDSDPKNGWRWNSVAPFITSGHPPLCHCASNYS